MDNVKNKKIYFEVTKYNPIFRDQNGYFVKKDEWLGYGSIGSCDDDGLLTREKYLEIENKYITAINYYIQFYKFEYFDFSHIEAYCTKGDFLEKDLYLYDYYRFLKSKKSLKIHVSNIKKLTQLILRSYVWGRYIFIESEYEIGFGSDYYMDFLIGDVTEFQKLKQKVIDLGLFWGRKIEDNII